MALWLLAEPVSAEQRRAAVEFVTQIRGDQRSSLSQWLKRHQIKRLAVCADESDLVWCIEAADRDALVTAFDESEVAFDTWIRDSFYFIYRIEPTDLMSRLAVEATFDTAVASNAWPE